MKRHDLNLEDYLKNNKVIAQVTVIENTKTGKETIRVKASSKMKKVINRDEKLKTLISTMNSDEITSFELMTMKAS